MIGNSKDIRFFALGLLLRAVASGISQPDVKSAPREDDVEPHSRESLLELAYNTWFEFAIPARGGRVFLGKKTWRRRSRSSP